MVERSLGRSPTWCAPTRGPGSLLHQEERPALHQAHRSPRLLLKLGLRRPRPVPRWSGSPSTPMRGNRACRSSSLSPLDHRPAPSPRPETRAHPEVNPDGSARTAPFLGFAEFHTTYVTNVANHTSSQGTGVHQPCSRTPTDTSSEPPKNKHKMLRIQYLRSLASSAAIAWITHQTASAVTVLDFVEVYGVNPTTGELRLNSLSDGEVPLPGSFLDVDGSGPRPAFSLAGGQYTWMTLGGRTALLGISPHPDGLSLLINGPGNPDPTIPQQVYLVPSTRTQGNGWWIERSNPPVPTVPDTAATLALFATSLAGLGVAGRRWRVTAR